MLVFLFLFLTRFLIFINNVFFLGFSLLFLRCFIVVYIWNFVSQWLGLVFFLVYITGVIVIFIFFCRFSKSTSGLFYNPFFSILFFVILRSRGLEFSFNRDFLHLSEARIFYSIEEFSQIFLLGFWLVFVLWGCLKILNIVGGVIR